MCHTTFIQIFSEKSLPQLVACVYSYNPFITFVCPLSLSLSLCHSVSCSFQSLKFSTFSGSEGNQEVDVEWEKGNRT